MLRSQLEMRSSQTVLLSGRENSAAQNDDFSKKKKVYFEQKGTAFKITQQLENYAEWNLDAVRKRQTELVESAKRIFLT